MSIRHLTKEESPMEEGKTIMEMNVPQEDKERGWFTLHLGRLSGMSDKLLEQVQIAAAEIDVKAAEGMVAEIAANVDKVILQAAVLKVHAMQWHKELKSQVEDLG